jgi:hypothetical protein
MQTNCVCIQSEENLEDLFKDLYEYGGYGMSLFPSVSAYVLQDMHHMFPIRISTTKTMMYVVW